MFSEWPYPLRHDAKPDVPIERESIMAMGLNRSEREDRPFKAYVYRGTGVDEHPEWDTSLPVRPPPPPKPVAVDAETYRKREVARIKAAAKRAREKKRHDEWFAKRMAEREEHRRSLVPEVMRPEVDHYEEPVQVYPKRQIRAARGWRPMTGADIENLLQELGE